MPSVVSLSAVCSTFPSFCQVRPYAGALFYLDSPLPAGKVCYTDQTIE